MGELKSEQLLRTLLDRNQNGLLLWFCAHSANIKGKVICMNFGYRCIVNQSRFSLTEELLFFQLLDDSQTASQ